MKNIAFLVFLFLNVQVAAAQEWAELLEDVRFESIIAANKSILDASDSINIEQDFGNEDHPINMNKLNAQMMKIALPFLNENQVQSFFQYKKLTGDLLNTYELQAIPNWDVETIKKCIHLLKVKKNMYNTCKERSKMAAIRQFSWRSYQNYAKPSIEEAANYLGAPLEMSLKYTYKKSNFVQWGFQANKDAGEPFFQGAQKYGFDFYSAHCFFKNLGFFKAIAIGDFTVNIGQGLMQWQSYSFGNLTDITSIKRQGPLLKPYTSVAENNFERGIAFTLVKSNKEWSFFVSKKPMDANLIQDTLNSDSEFKVTSIFNSGLHRTTSEISKKGNLQTKLIGSIFSIHTTNFKVGINFQHEEFSIPLQKNKTPFNYFSFSGKRHDLIGSDYAFSFHHVHFFGEAVWSNYQAMAIVSGFIKSISKKASINAFYRNIPSSYFSLASNPNIQNNETNNERGFYTGIQWELNPHAKWSACTDLFSFPYLTDNINSLHRGSYSAIQFDYCLDKKNQLIIKLTERTFFKNQSNFLGNIQPVTEVHMINGKIEWNNTISNCLNSKIKFHFVKNKYENNESNTGFLFLAMLRYKYPKKRFSVSGQYIIYETDDYATRLYCTEPEMNGISYGILFNKGCRVSSNLMITVSKKITFFGKIALQWKRTDNNHLNNLIKTNALLLKKELNFQLNYIF